MPSCPDRYRLQSYVDGQLGESEAAALAAHLQQCPACARAVAGLRQVSQPLADTLVAAPADLQARLLAAVAGLQPLPAISCQSALEDVNLRLDGELSHDRCQRLQAHLDGCAACARAAAELELTASLLRCVGEEATPVGLLQRIRQAVLTALGRPRRAPVPLLRRLGPSFGAVAAAAALVFMLLGRSPAPLPTQLATNQPPPSVTTQIPATTASVAPVRTAVASTTSRPPGRPAVAMPGPAGRSTPAAAPSTGQQRLATASAPPASVPTAPAVATAPRLVSPPVPTAPTLEPAPVTVAVAPRLHPETESAATPAAPRLHEAPAETLVARQPELPGATRVASADGGKSTPEVEVAARPAVAKRPRWVSRPATEDREVYSGDEGKDDRLAEAREVLRDHAQTMRSGEVRGFVIH